MNPAQNTPNDTQAEIMDATYRALCKHGYADLSISKIAEEFDMSKSSLYYHYEDKDELLVALLDHIIDRFSEEISVEARADAESLLDSFFDRLLPRTLDDEQHAFQVALFELRAQAPHHEEYREQFARTDRLLHETLTAYIEAGIEQGTFRAVDAEATARLLVVVIQGAMVGRVTTPDASIDVLRQAIDLYLNDYLTAERV